MDLGGYVCRCTAIDVCKGKPLETDVLNSENCKYLTPWKINVEPTAITQLERKNHLNQTSMTMFHVNLQGCMGKTSIAMAKFDQHLMVFSILPDNEKELFHCLLSLPEFVLLLFLFFWCKICELKISCTSVFPSSFASSSELHIKGGFKEIPHKKSESALEKNQKSTKHMIRFPS